MPTATDFKDYYTILGVSKTATPEEIKRDYRKLARKYHPDLNPGNQDAEAKFKVINEANEVLSDPEKRQKYDQFGQYWNQPGYTEAAPPRTTNAATENFSQYDNFDSFINDLLGGMRGGSTRRSHTDRTATGGFNDAGNGFRSQAPAPDTEAAIALTFSEAFHGVQKRLQLDDETINVRIPAGAKPSSRIRLKGKGRPSPFSQQRGDLYLTIEVLPHSFFRFEGDDLVCDVPLRPDEAVLGAQISVPPSGKSVIAYVAKGRGAIALGDPIGLLEERQEVIIGFQLFCEKNDWCPAFYQTLPDDLEVYKSLGYHTVQIGEEAIVARYLVYPNLAALPNVAVALVRADSEDRLLDYFKPG